MPKIKTRYDQDGPDIGFVTETLEIHHRHPRPGEATTKDIVGVMVCLGFLKENKITTPDLRYAYAKKQIDSAIDEDRLLLERLEEEDNATTEVGDKERALALEKQTLQHEKEKLALEKAQWKFEKRKNKRRPNCAIL